MTHIRSGVAAFALFAIAGAASAVTVPGGSATPTFIANLAAGTYQLVGTGIVDIAGDGLFRLRPDGKPETMVAEPTYGYFNPNGADNDHGTFGPAGMGTNLGSLVGTYTATPTMTSDFFKIGNSTTLTLGTGKTLYALVNDNYFPNNTGAFDVTVSAVPEPAQAALLLAGLGVVGMVGRRRTRKD